MYNMIIMWLLSMRKDKYICILFLIRHSLVFNDYDMLASIVNYDKI